MDNLKIKVSLADVHETLLLPLWGRAEAGRMKDPVLNDRKAGELLDRIDYDFTKFRSRFRRFLILSLAVRAKEFDAILRDFIREHPYATIVNIGAGLDTTYYRVNNGKIRWYDLDVPQVMRLRSRLLPDRPQSESIAKSMFDESFFEDIEPPRDGILFLAGGVLMYFEEERVKSFFGMISRRFPGAEVVFDSISPAAVGPTSRLIENSGIQGARMKWGFRKEKDLEEWGLVPVEQYPLFSKTRIPVSWGLATGSLMKLNNVFSVLCINRIKA